MNILLPVVLIGGAILYSREKKKKDKKKKAQMCSPFSGPTCDRLNPSEEQSYKWAQNKLRPAIEEALLETTPPRIDDFPQDAAGEAEYNQAMWEYMAYAADDALREALPYSCSDESEFTPAFTEVYKVAWTAVGITMVATGELSQDPDWFVNLALKPGFDPRDGLEAAQEYMRDDDTPTGVDEWGVPLSMSMVESGRYMPDEGGPDIHYRIYVTADGRYGYVFEDVHEDGPTAGMLAFEGGIFTPEENQQVDGEMHEATETGDKIYSSEVVPTSIRNLNDIRHVMDQVFAGTVGGGDIQWTEHGMTNSETTGPATQHVPHVVPRLLARSRNILAPRALVGKAPTSTRPHCRGSTKMCKYTHAWWKKPDGTPVTWVGPCRDAEKLDGNWVYHSTVTSAAGGGGRGRARGTIATSRRRRRRGGRIG